MGSTRRIEDRLARRGGAVELLRLPAALFGVIAGVRGALYDRGWLPRARVEAPVISVGNLTAGGTGKTPMVAWLVRELARRGLRPGIVSRGYGARRAAGGGLPEPNDEARELAELLARSVGPVPHVQDPDRAQAAHELLGAVDAIVLDDGFQHRRLARDLDLVMVDATRPWGLPPPGEPGEPVRALLPRGLLRERPEALARADAVVLTRADQVGAHELERLEAELDRLAPGVPVLRAAHRPARLRGFGGAPDGEPAELAGRTVLLVSGIGNPQAFEASVRALGARVLRHRRRADHHPYTAAEGRALAEEAEREGAWLLTTAKDAAKLAPLGLLGRALEVELELLSGAPVLEALLDALPPARALRERRSLHEGLHG